MSPNLVTDLCRKLRGTPQFIASCAPSPPKLLRVGLDSGKESLPERLHWKPRLISDLHYQTNLASGVTYKQEECPIRPSLRTAGKYLLPHAPLT